MKTRIYAAPAVKGLTRRCLGKHTTLQLYGCFFHVVSAYYVTSMALHGRAVQKKMKLAHTSRDCARTNPWFTSRILVQVTKYRKASVWSRPTRCLRYLVTSTRLTGSVQDALGVSAVRVGSIPYWSGNNRTVGWGFAWQSITHRHH